MSYEVGVSGVYHIDTGLNSVPVLGLRPLSKCPRAYLLPPAGCLHTFVVGWGLRELQGDASRVYQFQTGQDLAM